MKHKVRPYWKIKNNRISRKRRWYSLFEAWSYLKQRTPNYNYYSHNMQKGTVVYSYNEFYTASPKKNGAKPFKWQLIMFDRNFRANVNRDR